MTTSSECQYSVYQLPEAAGVLSNVFQRLSLYSTLDDYLQDI